MAIVSWGAPTLEFAPSTGGAAGTVFEKIDMPQKDSTTLRTSLGAEEELIDEEDAVVASRRGKASVTVEFDLFQKKGVERPWDDVDGVIDGEYTFRLTPEDPMNKGFIIDRCTVSVEVRWSRAEGTMLHYIVKGLKPATGAILKDYLAGGAGA